MTKMFSTLLLSLDSAWLQALSSTVSGLSLLDLRGICA
ncbi:hypothetical protein SPAR44_1921 [Streptococcus pneumoniae GA17301]|nr:hypothetical protein SPAR44_1921 [Streptococcus pneumoniae GA17301]